MNGDFPPPPSLHRLSLFPFGEEKGGSLLSCCLLGTHPEQNQFYCTCLSDNFVSCRSSENSVFMEDFSDMLLLKLLNISITAADDNEKVSY